MCDQIEGRDMEIQDDHQLSIAVPYTLHFPLYYYCKRVVQVSPSVNGACISVYF